MLVKNRQRRRGATKIISRIANNYQSINIADELLLTPITSMLLKLRLNGWLSACEKELLDSLSPINALVFLIKNKTYLHPQNTELFDYEIIEMAGNQEGEAIFTHRYQSETNSDHHQEYKIFTSVINPDEKERLILGVFGSEHCLNSLNEEARFMKLVNIFRKAYRQVVENADKVAQHLQDSHPVFIVNRVSGRLLAINSGIEHLLGVSPQEFMEWEFSRVQKLIFNEWSSHKIKMKNFSIMGLELCEVTLSATPSENKPNYYRHFIDEALNNLSKIKSAAIQLGSINELSLTEVKKSLSDIILNETDKTNNLLNNLKILFGFKENNYKRVNLTQLLEQTLERLKSYYTSRNNITINAKLFNASLRIQEKVVQVL
ncbi:MAG: hypothetical protein GXO93_08835, partial [FCB group bacterium]|nr:hypothetical protein [FCB group bacterium]